MLEGHAPDPVLDTYGTERAPHVVTHLIPAPASPDEEAAYEKGLRHGGYTGKVTVGVDHPLAL